MFVDELEIAAIAGTGGPGVVRWRREKSEPLGGPNGGNGGRGGDVYMRAVRDLSLLSKYTGSKEFAAGNGDAGGNSSQHGHDGKDYIIDVPVGATVTDLARERVFTFNTVGETHKILQGGHGGLGNEYFKSSTNRSPDRATTGKAGETGRFLIELSLIVDVGLVGFPNAGKSTLINALTNTRAKVGAYPFTTLEPHLGDLYGFVIADIPGLIEGASEGKGLGHKFLRHVSRTKMILHLISLEQEDVLDAYRIIHEELEKHDPALLQKNEWVLLTKSDLVSGDDAEAAKKLLAKISPNVFVVSSETGESIKELSDSLVLYLRNSEKEDEKSATSPK